MKLQLLAAAITLAFAPALHAEDAATGGQLPTVTVYGEQAGSWRANAVQVGTFRDLSPLNVPQTSNVVTREVLDAQGAVNLFGALRNTAGVTRSQLSGSTYDNIAIRGILVENRGNYRLNGSLPVINLVDIPLENKERVEVLKGAASLYYGFVPPSGIVNLVTKRATLAPVTAVSVGANEHGAASAHLDVGRRFGAQQQFGARINLAGGSEDTGIDHYEGKRALATGAFDMRVNSDLVLKLDLEHYRKDVAEQAAIALPAAVAGRITLPSLPQSTRNLASSWQHYDAQATNVLARADYRLGENWSVLAEAGHAKTERDRNFSQFQNYNLATGQGTLRIFFNRGQEWRNENYRTELNGTVGFAGLTHELTFGYTANERRADSRSQGSVDVPQNLYNPVAIAPRAPTAAVANAQSGIDDRGLYVSDRIVLNDQWQVMLGARKSRYESRTNTARYEADDVSPTLSVMFKPTARTSVYASYLEGVEESGQAPANRANAGELLAPAVARQKELGVKAEVAQGVLLQAAYFNIRRPSTTVDAANRFVLNGLAEYKGVELAASGEIGKQFSLVASALFMDAAQLNAGNTATFGKTPENTPERTASLFGEYRLAAVPGLSLNAGVFYTGARPVDNANQAFIGGYSTVSFGARYALPVAGRKTTLQAVVDNATDRNYWSTAGNGLIGVGAPRTLKVSAKMEF